MACVHELQVAKITGVQEMKPNDMQVGGNHYQSAYQHWDWALDMNLHFLPYATTKYLSRFDQKGGKQDVEKAGHYWAKYVEAWQQGTVTPGWKPLREAAIIMTRTFCRTNGLDRVDVIFRHIIDVEYAMDKRLLFEDVQNRIAILARSICS
jgi:hypothetical protein